jgi:raffinose/stachyose/melibiose transport system permease protein
VSRKPDSWNRYGLLMVPGMVLLGTVIGGALLWNVQVSLTRWRGYDNPVWAGLHNYRFLFISPDFRTSVLHGLWFTVPFAVLPTLTGLLIATAIYDYVIPRFGNGPATFLRTTLYLPQVVPVSITGLLWIAILDKSGLLNTVLTAAGHEQWQRNWLGEPRSAQVALSLIIFWLQLGYTTTIFIAGHARIDTKLYEAAVLDGAGRWQQFRHITLPQLRPEVFVVLLTTLIGALKIFAPVYWITGGGPLGATNVPSLYAFNAIYGGDQVPFGAAVASAFTVIVAALAWALVRLQHRAAQGLS